MNKIVSGKTLALTMGDPAGIGPEIIVKSILKLDPEERLDLLVIGDQKRLNMTAEGMACGDEIIFIASREAESGRSVMKGKIAVPVINPLSAPLPDLPCGDNYPEYGKASFAYLKRAIELAMGGQIAGIVTAPLAKHSLHLAGLEYPGHTEILQEFSGSPEVAMMFWGKQMKVLLATTHISLVQVAASLTKELLERKIKLLVEFLRQTGSTTGKPVAVAALNPHAGEDGAFGDEENLIIRPVLQSCSRLGLPVVGPIPADVLFYQAVQGRYDAVVALYHDQGLIPFKMLHFADGVNVTIGLPFVRTSVDHGTAFDIAGKNIADCSSMIEAIRLASYLSFSAKMI
ncbi:MAG: 4-hydroxythreonine-4-phosphate dehydrogenase PdxA [Deltaproteobacteria bacterium]|nr:4-hydroxythreonine-4-phosphate dehydrogenase PdxA [Deltaproteobacteria bacterium]